MKTRIAATIVCGFLLIGAAYAAPASPLPSPPVSSSAAPVPKPPLPPPPAAAPPRLQSTIVGLWEQSDEKGQVGAWFLFTERNGFYEGRLAKMFPKPGEPQFETCTKCTGDQKNARMLGLTIVDGMKRYGFDYKDGSILDPRDGSVYRAEMAMSPDGKTLAVRGYLFVPELGQTQIWKRLPDDALPPADIPKEILVTPTQH